ncbi:MAG: YbaB/EbfC family nucleoid-associated protein [Actinophytocola sp.]|uniref:YbaB/EbfC family nucleoid-associated protein n=1 Tax=Actinophytocola sp. TaxID=1872138 RepID=UPI003C771F1D
MDPEQWLAQYDKRITEAATRAEQAGERLRQVGATATSRRGEVEVRVSGSGTLEDLTLTPAARALEADELARLILDTTHKARRAVSAQIVGISTKYFGEGPALDVIKKHLPAGVPTKDRDEDDFFENPEITQ